MLYEIYFDSSDRFRKDKKTRKLANVFALEGDERFHPSFQFIQQSLRQYQKDLFHIPGSERSVVVDIVVAPRDDKFEVVQIIYDSQDILYASDGVTLINNYGFGSNPFQEVLVTDFEPELASHMVVPCNRLIITYSDSRAKNSSLLIPHFYKVQRLSS
jgi:hypothetical protein